MPISRTYDKGLNQFISRDMYNGALANMGLTTDPFTGSSYAFGQGNPVTNIEYDGHTICDAGFCPTQQQNAQVTQREQAHGAGCPSTMPGCPGYTPPAPNLGGGTCGRAFFAAGGACITDNAGPSGTGPSFAGIGHSIAGLFNTAIAKPAEGLLHTGGQGLATVTAVGVSLLTAAVSLANTIPQVAAGSESLVARLGSQVDAVHQILHPIAQEMRATAAIAARKGSGDIVSVFAGSGNGLTGPQKDLVAQLGGIVAPNIPGDTEITALTFIMSQRWTPRAGAASRPVCPFCMNTLLDSGAALTGPIYQFTFLRKLVLFGEKLFTWSN